MHYRCITESLYGAVTKTYWAGGRQLDSAPEPDQGFIWDHSGNAIDNTLWYATEPNDAGTAGQDVVGVMFMKDSINVGTLVDAGASNVKKSVCEYPMG